MKNHSVVMLGLGYIGLPTAALIASKKIKVLGIDVKKDVVSTINQGKIHIVEPDLDGLVAKVVKEKWLTASTDVSPADTYIITVPTPVRDNNQPDISYVESATRSIIPYLQDGNLLIIESTSPVGTTEKMQEIIYTERPELKDKIHLAYCPERVLPGNIIYELEHNDRAIGGIDAVSTRKAIDFYRQFVKGDLYPTNARTAEMVKLVENSSRDVQIAFANELSIISDKAGINVWELIELANKHPRVNILRPGTGVGGHCIAVDPWFIVSAFQKEAKLIRTAREINNYKTEWVIEKIKNAALQFEIENKKKPLIAAMGLAFKPDIDDLRESPSLYVARSLKMQGFQVVAVEPNINNSDEFELLPPQEALEKADIIAFLVGHKEFRKIGDLQKVVLDFVNVNQ
jgi:UDP-N-acetyl-D-mannosaminuronic acid dehydrogenase